MACHILSLANVGWKWLRNLFNLFSIHCLLIIPALVCICFWRVCCPESTQKFQ